MALKDGPWKVDVKDGTYWIKEATPAGRSICCLISHHGVEKRARLFAESLNMLQVIKDAHAAFAQLTIHPLADLAALRKQLAEIIKRVEND